MNTTRLRIERLKPAHIDDLFPLHSDPDVMRYIRAPDTRREQTIERVNQSLAHTHMHPDYGLFPAYLRADGRFIGWGALCHLEFNPEREVEVGYRLHKEFWNQGYATELAQALTTYGFQTLGLQRIVGITHPENKASQRVLEKLGLRYEKDMQYCGVNVKYFALDKR